MLKAAVEALNLRGAYKIPHSGRTLLQHLAGTYNILRNWSAPEEVALAGLYHSVYGGNHLLFSLFARNERSDVRQLIGGHAELLVFAYSKLEQRWWNKIRPEDINCTGGAPVDFRRLSLISLANLIELESSPIQEIAADALRHRLVLETWRNALRHHLKKS
jgi:hypothetical protein